MQRDEVSLELVSLPPPDARLFLPKNYEDKLVTPLDHHGFVDIDKTIELVISTVDPSFEYPKDVSVHHFQWPEAWYPNLPYEPKFYNPAHFRNLPIQKGLLLRCFENVLHEVTKEPPVPDRDEMAQRVAAWLAIRDLFGVARKTVQWQKRQKRRRELIRANPNIVQDGFDGQDIIGEEIMHEILEKHTRSFEKLLKRQEKIPEHHRIFTIETSPEKTAQNLGKFAARRNIDYRWKIAG